MGKLLSLLFVLMLATSIIVAAGCSSKEELAKPAEEVAKAPEPEKKAEEVRPEEKTNPSEAPAPGKK